MRPRHRHAESGFTLAETVVSLLIVTMIMVGALVLFDFNNRLTRVQTQVSEMQQSLRVAQDEMVRWLRMAGRGGLPTNQKATVYPTPTTGWHLMPTGVALEVMNNVGNNVRINPGDNTTPQVMPGSDVVTVRGVISDPVWTIQFQNAVPFNYNPATGRGTLQVEERTVACAFQSLAGLQTAINNLIPEAILLVSPLGTQNYAIVQLDPANSVTGTSSRCGLTPAHRVITLAFVTPRMPGQAPVGTRDLDYIRLSPDRAFPSTLTTVAYAGIVEEYRFYIKAAWTDFAGDLTPRLSRARVYPNTNVPYANSAANWEVDIADNIWDMQVALGIDTTTAAGESPDRTLCDGAAGCATTTTDEWLFNAVGDSISATVDNPCAPGTQINRWHTCKALGQSIRLSLLARTSRRDPKYTSPAITAIEDGTYGEPKVPANETQRQDRMFRRRLLTTEIGLRDIS